MRAGTRPRPALLALRTRLAPPTGGAPLRLRADAVTESNNREANMANAPAQDGGLFLVPKVIE